MAEYYCALDSEAMVEFMAALLHERRIIVTSHKLGKMSACVQAANELLYPLQWQNIFIPILPSNLKDYVLAPMPYLVGVPIRVYQEYPKQDVGDHVLVNVDMSKIITPFNDVQKLPRSLVKKMTSELNKAFSCPIGDTVARVFLDALVHLLGGVDSSIRPSEENGEAKFDTDIFIESRGSSMQPFLTHLLSLQMVQQFVEKRVAVAAAKATVSDEFQRQCCVWEEAAKRRSWKNPAKIFKSIKQKAQPAVESAIKTVKSGNKGMKSAYRGLKNKITNSLQSTSHSEPFAGTTEWWEKQPPVEISEPQMQTDLINSVDSAHITFRLTPTYPQHSEWKVDWESSSEESLSEIRMPVQPRKVNVPYERRKVRTSLLEDILGDSSLVIERNSENLLGPRLSPSFRLTSSKPKSTSWHVASLRPKSPLETSSPLKNIVINPPQTLSAERPSTQNLKLPALSPLVLAGLADSDEASPNATRRHEDELLQLYGIDFEKFHISRQNWTKFD